MTRAPSRARTRCSVGRPQDYFGFELDSKSGAHAVAHLSDEPKHVVGGGMPGVEKKISVAAADASVANLQALEAEFVDHAARGSSGGILENTTGTFLIE